MKFLLTLVLFVLSSGLSAADENPYREGTDRKRLTSAQISDLKEYVDYVKTRLTDALYLAKGKTFVESKKIFLKQIKLAVKASNNQSLHSQLLMRIILNQALHLVDGIPGKSSKGVLEKTWQDGVLVVILEDSVTLALQYYQSDRDAVNSGSILRLPYMRAAYERLVLGRLWISSISEDKYAYYGLRAILQHWLNTVMVVSPDRRAAFAKEILRVDKALAGHDGKSYSGSRLRELRGVVRKLERGLSKKWNLLEYVDRPEDKVTGFFIRPKKKNEISISTVEESFATVCRDGTCFETKEEYMAYKLKMRKMGRLTGGMFQFKMDVGGGVGAGSEGVSVTIGADVIVNNKSMYKLGVSPGFAHVRVTARAMGSKDDGNGGTYILRMERSLGEIAGGYISRNPERAVMLLPVYLDLAGLDDEGIKVYYKGFRYSGLASYSQMFKDKYEVSAFVRPAYIFSSEPSDPEDIGIADQRINGIFQLKTGGEVAYHRTENVSLRLRGEYEVGKGSPTKDNLFDRERAYRDLTVGGSLRWSKHAAFGEVYYEFIRRKSYGLSPADSLQYDLHLIGLKADFTP